MAKMKRRTDCEELEAVTAFRARVEAKRLHSRLSALEVAFCNLERVHNSLDVFEKKDYPDPAELLFSLAERAKECIAYNEIKTAKDWVRQLIEEIEKCGRQYEIDENGYCLALLEAFAAKANLSCVESNVKK